jgi:DNA-directed RNA polymerase specialized sigma24 family protein
MDERSRAIERLYRERYVGFRNAVATVTGDYESARDAVQEGFVCAYRSRAQFRGEGSQTQTHCPEAGKRKSV